MIMSCDSLTRARSFASRSLRFSLIRLTADSGWTCRRISRGGRERCGPGGCGFSRACANPRCRATVLAAVRRPTPRRGDVLERVQDEHDSGPPIPLFNQPEDYRGYRGSGRFAVEVPLEDDQQLVHLADTRAGGEMSSGSPLHERALSGRSSSSPFLPQSVCRMPGPISRRGAIAGIASL